jgi:hypothetical protein
VQIPLTGGLSEELTIVFRGAHVAVAGPWRLTLPLR